MTHTVQDVINRFNTMIEEDAAYAGWEIVLTHPFKPGARVATEFVLDAGRSQIVVDPDPGEMFETPEEDTDAKS